MEDIDYKKIINFVVESGKRLATKAGNIKDVGVTKINLTEEDIAIERGLNEIIKSFSDNHFLYAEEENDIFYESKHLWVVDPISGTKNLIAGLPHYSIVVAHLIDNKVVFAVVYDPSVDELFVAYKGVGAFLNDKPIRVNNNGNHKVILRPSSQWKDPDVIDKATAMLVDYEIENNVYSMAVNYCRVACGRADGVLSFTKDSFPEFAGGFILREAGGHFTNIHGHSDIAPLDRIFIGGNESIYNKLLNISREASKY